MALHHRELARAAFATELALIRNPGIRDFVIDVFEAFGHDGFFIRPASRSGKYHPFVNLNTIGVGGLVRHTRLVAYFASRLSRSRASGRGADHPQGEDLGEFHDQAVAAAILHDLMKDGDPTRAAEPDRNGKDGWKTITGCHGVDLAEAIWKRMLKGNATPDQILIMQGIASHMGPWTLPASMRPDQVKCERGRKVALLVADADYVAAQKSDDVIASMTSEEALSAYADLVKECDDPKSRENTKKAKAAAGVAAA